jgi:hypothetical protein
MFMYRHEICVLIFSYDVNFRTDEIRGTIITESSEYFNIFAISSLLSLLKKIKYAYEIMLLFVCMCFIVCVFPLINVWTPEPIFTELGTYITAPEPISTA